MASWLACVAVLASLLSTPARADFAAYNFFGPDVSVNYPYSLILADTTLFAGGENEVAAFDSVTGNKTWSSPINGRAYGLAVANGRLFVSTDSGYIYSYAQNQTSRQSSWMLF